MYSHRESDDQILWEKMILDDCSCLGSLTTVLYTCNYILRANERVLGYCASQINESISDGEPMQSFENGPD